MERLLALGSVVKVQMKEGEAQRLMIAGYFPKDKRAGKSYDYAAVPYPFGMQLAPVIRTFNRAQILEVEHQGYLDEKAEIYTRQLPELLEKAKEQMERMVAEQKQEAGPEASEQPSAVGEPSAASAAEKEPAGADTPFG